MTTPAALPTRGHAALRKGRYSATGQIYHVVTRTKDRQTLFQDFHAARQVIRSLRHEDESGRTQTLAFVVMPDHLHWLFALQAPGAELSRIVGAFKSASAHALGQPLWQSGYFDRAIRAEDDLPAVARYIVANPIRAGLVASVRDYPHWDAAWL